MLIVLHFVFKIAAVFYVLGLATAWLAGHRSFWAWLFLGPAMAANLAVVAGRYWISWPMLPMYLGGVALPFCLVGLALLNRSIRREPNVTQGLLIAGTCLALLAACFPKDFYLPFFKTKTLFSHFFFFFGVLGKTCFITSSVWAATGLIRSASAPANAVSRSFRWAVWGFGFWTLSMFSGEMWAYLGWGTPVVWDDPAVAAAMSVWFFYICLLHLHLTGTWSSKQRSLFAAFGAVVVGLNCLTELGPFRWPL